MKLLYSNILPIGKAEGQQTIVECICDLLNKADRVEIATGYVSHSSLDELEQLVADNKIKNICLNIGMYYIEGMPEQMYHTAVSINHKWQESNCGEIRIIKAVKYHGKVYCFYKDEKPFAAIIGSANLDVIRLTSSNFCQYEIASLITNENELKEIAEHIELLKAANISANIADITNMPLIRGLNTSLTEMSMVQQLPSASVYFYQKCPPVFSFVLPLKVPKKDERHLDDNKHFTRSNINVCYAAPRYKDKSRDWFDTQLTVGADVYNDPEYPKWNHPFWVVTDDGYWFKAHTTSDNNKQFSAVGDELIMGRWLKGRLVAAGLVNPVNDTQLDTDRNGMITQEMLKEYGYNCLELKKTGQTAPDTYGNPLDVWMLSMVYK